MRTSEFGSTCAIDARLASDKEEVSLRVSDRDASVFSPNNSELGVPVSEMLASVLAGRFARADFSSKIAL